MPLQASRECLAIENNHCLLNSVLTEYWILFEYSCFQNINLVSTLVLLTRRDQHTRYQDSHCMQIFYLKWYFVLFVFTKMLIQSAIKLRNKENWHHQHICLNLCGTCHDIFPILFYNPIEQNQNNKNVKIKIFRVQ